MTFEEALIAIKAGKAIKLPHRDWNLSLIQVMHYNSDIERPAHIIASEDILSDEWVILEDY